jgi:S-DNA-T family DNA segregation ATPase FtsK/SpoIIIE
LIKANLTSRVAFQVASHVDSRTILDTAGAETLLGSGDMLYVSSEFGKPKRVQGCYVLQQDVKKVIDFIQKENASEKIEEIEERANEEMTRVSEERTSEGGVDFNDPLYEEAKRIVIEYKKASASLLQRRLQIGYARAARLLDVLENKGVIGQADGAKAREVFAGGGSDENNDGFVDPSKLEFTDRE